MWRREWETRAWAHEREPREDDITLQSKTCVTQTWDVSNGPGVINPTNCICTNGDGSYPVACFCLHVSSYYANVSCKICDSKIILCLFVCLFIAPICVYSIVWSSRGLSRSSIDHHPLPEEADDDQTLHQHYLHDLHEAVSAHNRCRWLYLCITLLNVACFTRWKQTRKHTLLLKLHIYFSATCMFL